MAVSSLIILILMFSLNGCQEDVGNDFVFADGLVDWKRLFVDSFNDLNDVYFVNGNSGWAVGENRTLLSTSSGDLGWSRAPVLSPIEDLRAVFFVDFEVGWVAGNLTEATSQGQIAYSTMGGGYPIQQYIAENPINTLYFINEEQGWAAGDNGHIIKTEDGGETWERISGFTDNKINDICLSHYPVGWAATSNGEIFRMMDGENWELTETGIMTDVLAVHFIDELHGWACSSNNTILKWESGPDNNWSWHQYTIPEEARDMEWTDIFFVNANTGWVIGDFGRVYKSTDGGNTWVEEESSVDSKLNAIYMVNENKGWIVGDNGVIISYSPR